MASLRVLVVDQQNKINYLINEVIETFDTEFNVVSVPSGEEALLEIRARNFDLLVTKTSLVGIDGIDLMKKTSESIPNIKTILISKTRDDQLEREALDAGAYAFFTEPFERKNFLASVGRSLGLIDSKLSERDGHADGSGEWNLFERLTNLRRELGAICSILLDNKGTILARSGDLPDIWIESSLLPPLMASFSVSNKVASFLKVRPPRDFSYISGQEFDLILAHVSDSISLLEILNPIDIEANLNNIVADVNTGRDDIHEILLNLGVSMEMEEEPAEEEVEDLEALLEAEAPRIDEIFQEVATNVPEAEEVDAFWQTFADQEMADGVQSDDVMTYEQALRLGIAPKE